MNAIAPAVPAASDPALGPDPDPDPDPAVFAAPAAFAAPAPSASRQLVAEADQALARLGAIADDAARADAEAAVGALLELYGVAIRQLTAAVEAAGGNEAVRAAARDELVGHLLLLHDAHPESVEERVLRALEDVRPGLGAHGGDVELLGVDDGVARLRLHGSCNGCAASSVTLKLSIEEAIARRAPDVDRVVAEEAAAHDHGPEGDHDATAPGALPAPAFIPLESLRRGSPAPRRLGAA